MSENSGSSSSNGVILFAAAIIAAGAIGTGVYFSNLNGSEPEQINPAALVAPETPDEPAETAALQPEVQASEPDAPVVADPTQSTDVPDAPAEPQAEEPEDTQVAEVPEDPETPVPPSIDEVRVEADGLTIVAGRAKPGARVTVLLDGVENTEAPVDGNGSFAAVTFIAPSPDAQVLSISQHDGDETVVGLDEIIIAPVAPQVAEVPDDAPEDVVAGDTAVADAEVEAPTEPAGDDVIAAADAAGGAEVEAAEEVLAQAPASADVSAEVSAEAQAALDAANSTAPSVSTDVSEIALGGLAAPGGLELTVPGSGDASQTASAASLNAAPQDGDDQLALVDPNATRSPAPLDRQAPSEPETPGLPGGQVTTETNADSSAGTLPDDVEADTELPPVTSPNRSQVAILKSTAEGVEVVGRAPVVQDNVSIDTISYSAEGEVQLSGRAQQDSRVVRVYLDNAPITTLEIDPDGRWRGDLPDVDTGIYRLRVDEVAGDGEVTSRLETPFKREDPEVLQANETGEEVKAKRITVQTGNTLWAIARDRYGEGLLFVEIFEANKESIRDPNLIFPGQVFELPE